MIKCIAKCEFCAKCALIERDVRISHITDVALNPRQPKSTVQNVRVSHDYFGFVTLPT
jgi:hypothetical protein